MVISGFFDRIPCFWIIIMEIKTIKIKANISDPKGILIPRGVQEQISAEIADQVAVFRFRNSSVTRRFAKVVIELEREKGKNDTIYNERMQKIITKYPGKSKEEIRDLILKQLNQLNIKKKNVR